MQIQIQIASATPENLGLSTVSAKRPHSFPLYIDAYMELCVSAQSCGWALLVLQHCKSAVKCFLTPSVSSTTRKAVIVLHSNATCCPRTVLHWVAKRQGGEHSRGGEGVFQYGGRQGRFRPRRWQIWQSSPSLHLGLLVLHGAIWFCASLNRVAPLSRLRQYME